MITICYTNCVCTLVNGGSQDQVVSRICFDFIFFVRGNLFLKSRFKVSLRLILFLLLILD